MSNDESSESADAVYQTPTAIVLEEPPTHEELESAKDLGDLGASPEFSGPVTRSGKKRKNSAPVKSAGKKKNKMMTSRTPPKADGQSQTPTSMPGPAPVHSPQPGASQSAPRPAATAAPDIAALFASDLSNLNANIQQSMAGMEGRLAEKIGNLENNVKSNKDSIVILTDSLNKATVDLARLEHQIQANEDGLESRVAHMVRSVMSRDSRPVGTGAGLDLSSAPGHEDSRHPSGQQIDRYVSCRRSLRLWPIRGSDMLAEVRRFLTERLGFQPGQVDQDFGPMGVRRVVEPKSKIEAEVIVEFQMASLRDSIKSMGFKLEGQRAGIRIEIPNFLKSDFHVLQNLSYRLKLANKEMKRSVKFDDENYGLMLDVQLPGQEWRRIRPAQARAARRADPSLRSGPSELSLDMIVGAINGHDGQSVGTPAPLSLLSSASSSSAAPPVGRTPRPLGGPPRATSSTTSDPPASGGNATPLGPGM